MPDHRLSTLTILGDLILSGLLLVGLLVLCEVLLIAWRRTVGRPAEDTALARDRHPSSRALPRRWE